jgi:FlaA1/EpsC-like NDP-sugar epimerase
METDFTLRRAMSDYIMRSREQIARLDRNLDAALRGVREIVIWGAGQTTLTLLAHTQLGGARPIALADSNPRYHGRRLGGVPVVPPEHLASLDVPVLIGTLIHHVAIAQRIREMGLPNRVVRLSVE